MVAVHLIQLYSRIVTVTWLPLESKRKRLKYSHWSGFRSYVFRAPALPSSDLPAILPTSSKPLSLQDTVQASTNAVAMQCIEFWLFQKKSVHGEGVTVWFVQGLKSGMVCPSNAVQNFED